MDLLDNDLFAFRFRQIGISALALAEQFYDTVLLSAGND